jgi:hypothetical protein
MKRTALALSAIAGLVLVTAAATPQDEWVAQVRRQIRQAGQIYEQRGYSLTHQIFTGSLAEGSNTFVTVRLVAGNQYQIMGVCDNDCSDLDLVLYDPAGNEVDDDLEMDDYPIVAVTPRRAGAYRVKVVMATCTREPCRFGLGTFGK